MNKKIIILTIIVLLIFINGIFLWQESQKDVRELNKNLPEGVKVVKSLIGNEYKVVNKIDGYEFKTPKEWGGLSEIEYIPEREMEGFFGTNITIEGINGEGKMMGISYFKQENDLDLRDWTQEFFEKFGFTGDLTPETIRNVEILKIQENIHLGGMYIYFFKKDSKIYTITCGAEEFVQEIIINGKW